MSQCTLTGDVTLHLLTYSRYIDAFLYYNTLSYMYVYTYIYTIWLYMYVCVCVCCYRWSNSKTPVANRVVKFRSCIHMYVCMYLCVCFEDFLFCYSYDSSSKWLYIHYEEVGTCVWMVVLLDILVCTWYTTVGTISWFYKQLYECTWIREFTTYTLLSSVCFCTMLYMNFGILLSSVGPKCKYTIIRSTCVCVWWTHIIQYTCILLMSE